MSQVVIDASIALSWLLPDEMASSSMAARNELLAADTIWVAAHWSLDGVLRAVAAKLKVRLVPDALR